MTRPDPEELLNAIRRDEGHSRSGRLRVFFGMSAGVGKTYTMLRAAHQRLREGQNVVIGYIETHGRQETLALVEGLPQVPRKKVDYRGTKLEEMDLDEILKRKPELVLVDELAHTNAPGSRHPKRYQDVLEILDAGIDVYTTVNVQHLESRKESVETITGIQIRETVPDSILERAFQVELVDVAPIELLKRLKEGKVYLGDKALRAAENFFKEDRLTALREIALRLTAERVDQDLQKFVAVRGDGLPWSTNERLMVAISHSPHSERLIRATRRQAYNLEAPWLAVYVDTGNTLTSADQAQLSKNMALVRELKGEVVMTTDSDIAGALRRVARQKNVTQIVVGRPTRTRIMDILQGGTLLDRLVYESREIDVHVVQQEPPALTRRRLIPRFQFTSGFLAYWSTFVAIVVLSVASRGLQGLIGYRTIGFVFLIGILFIGMFAPIGPVLFAATLSSVIWNFFFIPPTFTFAIQQPDDIILCLAYFIVACITGYLTHRIRHHERLMHEHEQRVNVLYDALKDISGSTGKEEFLPKVLNRVGELLKAECRVVLKDEAGRLKDRIDRGYSGALNEKEFAVASWTFENRKAAGWSTDTLAQGRALYLPMVGASEIVGVLIFKPQSRRRLGLDEENLLYSVTKQLALALERHFINKRLRQSEKLQESEKLHQALLNSISHELRTPLTSVLGAAAALNDDETSKNSKQVKSLGYQLLISADRLNRVIENLLDMSRLNSGVLALKVEWHDVSDLIGVAIQKLGANLLKHQLELSVQDSMKLVPIDFRFMEHALSNVILNATQYAPEQTKIKITAEDGQAGVRIIVEDEGPGFPPGTEDKVFEKFYRVPGTPAGGTGLGLSIMKSIVEAHGGVARAENREQGGARFVIEIPRTGEASTPPEVRQ